MRPRRIIACATVVEELRRMGIEEDELKKLDFGLHVYPESLRETLQSEIDASQPGIDIILGYGLCSNAVIGLSSASHRLIIPRIDDCIALFLGSKDEYMRRLSEEPGTYFLTKGWIEAADHPYKEFLRISERYGTEKAMRITKLILANYTRMVLIDTGNYLLDECRETARMMAEVLELRYEEIPGSNRMLRMLLEGDWSGEFIVLQPGETMELSHFGL
jgi:Protein of unknown function (DUF1638)